MKTVAVITVLLYVTQVRCVDESPTPTISKAKRQTYNYPQNYYESNDCTNPPACLSVESIPNQTPETAVDIGWLNQTQLMYIAMSSCWGYNFAANLFLGRKPFGDRELQEMCFAQFFGDFGLGETISSGYGKQYYQNCTSVGDAPNSINCTNVGGDPGTDWSLEGYDTDYPVLSDGVSWVLYYRCVDNRHGDFQLFSKRRYLEKSIVTQAMAMIVTHFGFPANAIKLLPCYFPTYPVPLQNYPEPDSALSQSCPSYQSHYSPPPSPQPTPEPVNPPHYNHPPSHHPY